MDEHTQNEFYCKGFVPTPARPPRPAPAPRPVHTPKPAPPPTRAPRPATPVPSPGPEWRRPDDLPWPDEVLRRVYCDSRGAFFRQMSDGFELAYPLNCRLPFPLPPLFCFAQVRCLGNRGWWVFSFGPDALPRFRGV